MTVPSPPPLSALVPTTAARLQVPERALRAVLRVECGSDDPARWLGPGGRAIVRVEAHLVLRRLAAPTTYGLRVVGPSGPWRGGPGEPPGAWSLPHEVEVDGSWWAYHGRQERRDDGTPGEYDALDVAALVLPDGMEGACACSSWGPGQVMGHQHAALGLPLATAVRDLAGTPEGGMELVVRFLERVKPWALAALRSLDWRGFAGAYNGTGQVDHYAALLAAAHDRLSA